MSKYVMMVDASDDYLKHYGVLGMKWGVRHIKPSTPRTTKYKRGESKIGWDQDMQIKKGTKMYRISANKNDTGGMRYVTVDQNDRDFYKGTWGYSMRGAVGSAESGKKLYEHTYKATKTLKLPSAEKRQKMAYDISKTDDFFNARTKMVITRKLKELNNVSMKEARKIYSDMETADPKAFKDIFKDYKDNQIKYFDSYTKEHRAMAVLASMGESDEIRKMFVDKVKENGYNATIDDHGADFGGKARKINAPIIVLDGEDITQKKSKEISTKDEAKAFRKYDKNMLGTLGVSGKAAKKYFVPNVIKDYFNEDNYYNSKSIVGYDYDTDEKKVRKIK